MHLLPKSKKIEIIELDLEDHSTLDLIVQEPCDYFVGLAWDGTRGPSRDDNTLQEKNYKIAIDTLKAVIRLGCSVVMSAGSQAEYGNHSDIITETSLENPVTAYGRYKLKYYYEASKICKESNLRFIEPRFFSVYGEDDESSMILPTIKKFMVNQTADFTLCEQLWNFIHIDDVVHMLQNLLYLSADSGVYNIANDETRPLKEFIKIMHNLTRSTSALNFGAVPYHSAGVVNLIPDISKVKIATKYVPQVYFEEGISRIISNCNLN